MVSFHSLSLYIYISLFLSLYLSLSLSFFSLSLSIYLSVSLSLSLSLPPAMLLPSQQLQAGFCFSMVAVSEERHGAAQCVCRFAEACALNPWESRRPLDTTLI